MTDKRTTRQQIEGDDDVFDFEDFEPPDGGFGWVIVFVAFSVQFLVLGSMNNFGILFTQLLKEFKDSKQATCELDIILFLLFQVWSLCGSYKKKNVGDVAERLRHRSREQKVPSSIPRLDKSVLRRPLNANFHRVCLMLRAPLDRQYAELPLSASDAVLCTVLVCKMWVI